MGTSIYIKSALRLRYRLLLAVPFFVLIPCVFLDLSDALVWALYCLFFLLFHIISIQAFQLTRFPIFVLEENRVKVLNLSIKVFFIFWKASYEEFSIEEIVCINTSPDGVYIVISDKTKYEFRSDILNKVDQILVEGYFQKLGIEKC